MVVVEEERKEQQAPMELMELAQNLLLNKVPAENAQVAQMDILCQEVVMKVDVVKAIVIVVVYLTAHVKLVAKKLNMLIAQDLILPQEV
jgi:hypothetical protein